MFSFHRFKVLTTVFLFPLFTLASVIFIELWNVSTNELLNNGNISPESHRFWGVFFKNVIRQFQFMQDCVCSSSDSCLIAIDPICTKDAGDSSDKGFRASWQADWNGTPNVGFLPLVNVNGLNLLMEIAGEPTHHWRSLDPYYLALLATTPSSHCNSPHTHFTLPIPLLSSFSYIHTCVLHVDYLD